MSGRLKSLASRRRKSTRKVILTKMYPQLPSARILMARAAHGTSSLTLTRMRRLIPFLPSLRRLCAWTVQQYLPPCSRTELRGQMERCESVKSVAGCVCVCGGGGGGEGSPRQKAEQKRKRKKYHIVAIFDILWKPKVLNLLCNFSTLKHSPFCKDIVFYTESKLATSRAQKFRRTKSTRPDVVNGRKTLRKSTSESRIERLLLCHCSVD